MALRKAGKKKRVGTTKVAASPGQAKINRTGTIGGRKQR